MLSALTVELGLLRQPMIAMVKLFSMTAISLNRNKDIIKTLRKELQQIRTPSSKRRLKTISQRENRWMQDVNHCVSKALVENNPDGTLFVIEDLTGIQYATEKILVKDRYVTVSWSYFDLEQKLTYKALKHHQLVEQS